MWVLQKMKTSDNLSQFSSLSWGVRLLFKAILHAIWIIRMLHGDNLASQQLKNILLWVAWSLTHPKPPLDPTQISGFLSTERMILYIHSQWFSIFFGSKVPHCPQHIQRLHNFFSCLCFTGKLFANKCSQKIL